jgi:glutathione S-transferase
VTALTLYLSPGSSSMAVHIALHEIGLPFETKSLSFHRKEHRQPPFLAINPAGKVPTLMVDGTAVTEVAGCLLYLAKRFPEARLLPVDPLAEAQAVSWMSFIASTLHPARRMGEEHVAEVWTLADKKFGERDWVLGNYSVADIHLFRLYWRMVNAPRPHPKGLRHLELLYERMMVRPAVQRTIKIESELGYELPA